MRILLLGTGAIGSSYFSASTLVNDDILVDLPNGIVKNMRRYRVDISKIKYIFITHLHGDHFMDLPFYMLYKFMNNIESETIIYGPAELEEKVEELYRIAFPGDYERIVGKINVKFRELRETEKIELEDGTKVSSILVDHGDLKPAYGYIIDDGEHKAGFSGDSVLTDSIEEMVEETDIAILDTNFPEEGNAAHMGLNDIEYLCEKYQDTKIVCTHMKDISRERAKTFNYSNIVVPEDGESIVI